MDLLVTSLQGVYRSIDGGVTWQLTLSGGQATALVRPSALRVLAAIAHQTDANVTLSKLRQRRHLGPCPRLPERKLPVETMPTRLCTLPCLAANCLLPIARIIEDIHAVPHHGCMHRRRGLELGGRLGGTQHRYCIPALERAVGRPDEREQSLSRGADLGDLTTMAAPQGDCWLGHSPCHHHAVATHPLAPNIIYSLNDGGIYVSDNRGWFNSWEFIGDGIANVEFYDHAAAPTKPVLVIGGTQDNGTIIRPAVGSSTVWHLIHGGDGATVDIDPTKPTIMYAINQDANSIVRSGDGGASRSSQLRAPWRVSQPALSSPYQDFPRRCWLRARSYGARSIPARPGRRFSRRT